MIVYKLENLCPKGMIECPKCRGVFKASEYESHCCVSHLYELIQDLKQNSGSEVSQINEGWQQMSQALQDLKQGQDGDRAAINESLHQVT